MPDRPLPWPREPDALEDVQRRLAELQPRQWEPFDAAAVGGSYVCFARGLPTPGRRGEPGWAGASCKRPGRRSVVAVAAGAAGAAYEPGRLALREGPLRAAALAALAALPDVLLVDATGRDHPRRAGLALHLGAVVDVPSIGVTDRPLVASGEPPGAERGAVSPLRADGEIVGHAVRCRTGVRPVCVSPGWRMSPAVAVEVVLAATRRARTPQPLREARRAARGDRGRAGG